MRRIKALTEIDSLRAGGPTRRGALGLGAAVFGYGLSAARPARAQSGPSDMRGALDASEAGVRPGAVDNQSAALSKAMRLAEAEGRALFLPPGLYEVSRVELPARTHLVGVPGQTRLIFRGEGFLLRARHAASLRLTGITLEGAERPFAEDAAGLLDADDVDHLALDDCDFSASTGAGAMLRNCAGWVERCRLKAVRTVGLDLIQSRGMSVAGNEVADCGDTGILVSRDDPGADDTIVRGNRVSTVRADSGGTGQYGNGINVSKANGVIVADNRIDDCSFSAIRCFSSDNSQISGNVATRSGEMAIYVEFAFEGAVVAGNIVDEAAFGISFANFAEHGGRLAVCSGNVVRNISGVSRLPRGAPIVGTGIAVEADVAVTGNVIENAARAFQLGWGPYLRDVSATGNVIRNTEIGIGVSVVEGSGPALIANNLISGTGQSIVGMRWEEMATGDLAVSGAEAFPQLTIAGNRLN